MSWDIVLVTVHAQKALLKAKNLAIFIRETEGKKKTTRWEEERKSMYLV